MIETKVWVIGSLIGIVGTIIFFAGLHQIIKWIKDALSEKKVLENKK